MVSAKYAAEFLAPCPGTIPVNCGLKHKSKPCKLLPHVRRGGGGIPKGGAILRSAPLGRILLATFLAGTRKVALRRMQCYEFAAENAHHTVLLHGRPQGSPLRGFKHAYACFKLQFIGLSNCIAKGCVFTHPFCYTS